MSLRDLTLHTAAQANAIDEVLNNGYYLTTSWPESAAWHAFRDSVWKTGFASFQNEEPVERGDNPIKDSEILPDIVPPTCLVANIPRILFLATNLKWTKRILVRSEYGEAEKATLDAAEDDVESFVVTGQPGIVTPTPRFTVAHLSDL